MGWQKSSRAWATIGFFVYAVSQQAAAQPTLQLSLNQAISAAGRNNAELGQATLDERMAAARYRQTLSALLPQADLTYTAVATNDPLGAFGFKLQQRTVSQNDFTPSLLNHPATSGDYSAQLQIRQPLIAVAAWMERKSAEKQVESTHYRTARSREYLRFQVHQAFVELQLGYRAIGVWSEALQTARSVYTDVENRFNQGFIQKSDLLNAQVRVASVNNQLTRAKSAVLNLSDELGLLMGEQPGTAYVPEELPDTDPQPLANSSVISPLRADLLAIQKAIDASQLLIKARSTHYLPQLNAFGTYQFHDDRPMGFGSKSYFAGLTLSWNIFTGTRNKNVLTEQRLAHDKLVLQLHQQQDKGQLELDKARRDLLDTQAELEQDSVLVNQARESLRILQNRYQQGLVNTTEVLTAHTQLAQQQLLLAQATFNASVIRAYLQFLTASGNSNAVAATDPSTHP